MKVRQLSSFEKQLTQLLFNICLILFPAKLLFDSYWYLVNFGILAL